MAFCSAFSLGWQLSNLKVCIAFIAIIYSMQLISILKVIFRSVHLLTDWSSREWIGSFQLFSTAFGPCFSQLTSLKEDPCCGFLSLSPLYTLSNNSMLSCISTFLHPPVLQDLTWILEGFVRIPREGRLSSSLFMIYLIYLTLCSRLFVFILRICTAIWEITLTAMQKGIRISYLDLRMPLHAQTDHSLSTFWSGNPFMPLLFIRNEWLYSLEQFIK